MIFHKKLNLPRFHGMSKIPLIIMNMVRINWTGASTHPAIPCETLIKKILSLSKIFIFNQWKKKPIVKEFDWRTKELNHKFIYVSIRFSGLRNLFHVLWYLYDTNSRIWCKYNTLRESIQSHFLKPNYDMFWLSHFMCHMFSMFCCAVVWIRKEVPTKKLEMFIS